MQKFVEYLKDTRAEMKHVSWPTKDQTVSYTILVIILSVAVALFLSAFDSVFTKLLEIVIVK
jgi:preprotein translocase subunit SecE